MKALVALWTQSLRWMNPLGRISQHLGQDLMAFPVLGLQLVGGLIYEGLLACQN